MTRLAPTWWSVVLDCERPESYGPYRSEEAARAVADTWNNSGNREDEYAYVTPMKSGPIR